MSDNAVGTTGFVSIVQKELNRSAAIPAVAMPSHADYVLYAGPESRSDTHAKSTFRPRLSTAAIGHPVSWKTRHSAHGCCKVGGYIEVRGNVDALSLELLLHLC